MHAAALGALVLAALLVAPPPAAGIELDAELAGSGCGLGGVCDDGEDGAGGWGTATIVAVAAAGALVCCLLAAGVWRESSWNSRAGHAGMAAAITAPAAPPPGWRMLSLGPAA